MTTGQPTPDQTWYPVATEHDVPHRHICQGQLLGRELAIWRADDNFVNVWENRCLHRGVRLSIGVNDGAELTCRYHGWRYANRSGGCTYIPAHPADAPARTIYNRSFPAQERYGLVWSGLEPVGDVPAIPVLDDGTPFGLRNLPVNAGIDQVVAALRDHRFLPSGELERDLAQVETSATVANFVVTITAALDTASTVVFFVQPVDAGRSVIRPVLCEAPGDAMAVLRHHADRLRRLVADLEALASPAPPPDPLAIDIAETAVALAATPTPTGRTAPLRVNVARKWTSGQDIAAFELRPLSGTLPAFQPGAHIDIHLPNGLVRQYSITNGPGESAFYRIAVKLDPASTGGSSAMHDQVREGDVLAISEPRNNFPLRRDAERTILIAGGVGITPMIAMAQALATMDLSFDLHYFVRSSAHVALPEVLEPLGSSVNIHAGRSPQQTETDLQALLTSVDPAAQVYACGPGPMLDAVRAIASQAGWPDSAVHFEYFANTTPIDDSSSFTIALARSALTLRVPSGVTILDVLRDNGIAMTSSCEHGACGTCAATVIEGDPLHQDVYLNATERLEGNTIMTCVSRATSDRLVLDL